MVIITPPSRFAREKLGQMVALVETADAYADLLTHQMNNMTYMEQAIAQRPLFCMTITLVISYAFRAEKMRASSDFYYVNH